MKNSEPRKSTQKSVDKENNESNYGDQLEEIDRGIRQFKENEQSRYEEESKKYYNIAKKKFTEKYRKES